MTRPTLRAAIIAVLALTGAAAPIVLALLGPALLT